MPPPAPPTAATTRTITVGIDVGTQTVKAVLGPTLEYEIVRCGMGGHSTPNAVTFRDGARLVGEQAAEARSADGNTVLHLNRLLPGGGAADAGDALADFYRFDHSCAAEGGDEQGSSVAVEYDGSKRTFTSSALLAMLLGKVKSSVDATVDRLGAGGSDGSEVRTKYVLSLPPGATLSSERAVLDAAFAAGLGDDASVADASECAAAAYGRKWAGDADEAETQSRTVAVVDMGHSQTIVSILRLGGGGSSPDSGDDAAMADTTSDAAGAGDGDEKSDEKKDDDADDAKEAKSSAPPPSKSAVTVLGSACRCSLGAGSVDVHLWHHFKSTLPGLSDLKPSSRGGQRLLEGCRKLKHLLSMLPNGSVTVECLGSDERDVTLTATREVLEDLCKAEAEALKGVIGEALASAAEGGMNGSPSSDIDSVEVLGGGCRIPLFQKTILASTGRDGGSPEKDLSHGLDDTSAALGAAAMGDDEVGAKLVARSTDNKMDAELTDADRERREALKDAEATMAGRDAEMARRSEARNGVESHVLEMRSARHGTHGKLLPDAAVLDKYLDELDDWLFSEECDGLGVVEMEAKLAAVLKETSATCADYFAAVKKEAEEKEREMEEEAKQAEAEKAAGGGDDDENDDHDTRRLPKKRRMEIVMKNKNEANELLKDGNYRHAAARYHKALTHCGKFYDLSPDDTDEVKAVKLSLHLNLALAYMKLEKPDNALRSCNDALDLDPDNVKALFRRASVNYEKKKWDDAAADATRAAEAAPDDKAVKKLQARIEQQQKRQKAKQKKMAQKMFG